MLIPRLQPPQKPSLVISLGHGNAQSPHHKTGLEPDAWAISPQAPAVLEFSSYLPGCRPPAATFRNHVESRQTHRRSSLEPAECTDPTGVGAPVGTSARPMRAEDAAGLKVRRPKRKTSVVPRRPEVANAGCGSSTGLAEGEPEDLRKSPTRQSRTQS